ncbi:MAG: helix-turn-helix domain-containing protein [Oligoflexia bacterium]|nr:helix-turn-helix domain-containing protein [Oligoflexia bacterium]
MNHHANKSGVPKGEILSYNNSSNIKLLFNKQIQEQEWITTDEAAKYLGISKRCLLNNTSQGKIPFYKFGRRNRYRLDELRQLLLSQRRGR